MASLRVKPVILGRKSDLTEQHLKLPSKVTHSMYFSSNLCMSFPERHPGLTFSCPSSDPHTYQVMSFKHLFELLVAWVVLFISVDSNFTHFSHSPLSYMHTLVVAPGKSDKFLTKCPLRNSLLLSSGFLFS